MPEKQKKLLIELTSLKGMNIHFGRGIQTTPTYSCIYLILLFGFEGIKGKNRKSFCEDTLMRSGCLVEKYSHFYTSLTKKAKINISFKLFGQ